MIHKACPVALHPDGAPQRLPVFSDSQAGPQLVRGTLTGGADPTRAAAQALFEASGLETRAALPLGQSHAIVDGEIWHFVLCRIAPPVRERWQHASTGCGGRLRKFHWHALDAAAPLPPPAQSALSWIKAQL